MATMQKVTAALRAANLAPIRKGRELTDGISRVVFTGNYQAFVFGAIVSLETYGLHMDEVAAALTTAGLSFEINRAKLFRIQ